MAIYVLLSLVRLLPATMLAMRVEGEGGDRKNKGLSHDQIIAVGVYDLLYVEKWSAGNPEGSCSGGVSCGLLHPRPSLGLCGGLPLYTLR